MVAGDYPVFTVRARRLRQPVKAARALLHSGSSKLLD
jgi:hypothetical protein